MDHVWYPAKGHVQHITNLEEDLSDIVNIALGGGGKQFQKFLKDIILNYLGNDILNRLGDASYINLSGEISYSTDSFIIDPEFFRGGDIGKLAVYGTCNDLVVSGAKPEYLSLSFIVSEGYRYDKLERIVQSIKEASIDVGVKIVAGDTKVIPRLEREQILINTSGLGKVIKKLNDYNNIRVGDMVIFTSDIARHGISILLEREGVEHNIESDCGNLWNIFSKLDYKYIKFARDATRGGVAAVLNEISNMSGLGFEIDEKLINIDERVKYFCEFFGYDPLQIANEGLAVIVVDSSGVDSIMGILKSLNMGKNASVVGTVIEDKKVMLNTYIGGRRYVEMPYGEILPRIC
ncbi:MAG: hydrogenase expression/formation protein HypE [Deferribacterales bacterium]